MTFDIIKQQLAQQRDFIAKQAEEVKTEHEAQVAELVKQFRIKTDGLYDQVLRLDMAIDALDGKLPMPPAAAPVPVVIPPAPEPAPQIVAEVLPPPLSAPPPVKAPEPEITMAEAVAEVPKANVTTTEAMAMSRHSRTNVTSSGKRGASRTVCPKELKVGIVINFDFGNMSRMELDHPGNFHAGGPISMLLLEMKGDRQIWIPLVGSGNDEENLEIPASMKLHPGFIGSSWLKYPSWVIRDRFNFTKHNLLYSMQIGESLRAVNHLILPKVSDWVYRVKKDIVRLAQ